MAGVFDIDLESEDTSDVEVSDASEGMHPKELLKFWMQTWIFSNWHTTFKKASTDFQLSDVVFFFSMNAL